MTSSSSFPATPVLTLGPSTLCPNTDSPVLSVNVSVTFTLTLNTDIALRSRNSPVHMYFPSPKISD